MNPLDDDMEDGFYRWIDNLEKGSLMKYAEHFEECHKETGFDPATFDSGFGLLALQRAVLPQDERPDNKADPTVRENHTPENLGELRKEAYQEGFDKGRLYEAMLQKEPIPETYISNTTGPICKLPHLNSHNLLDRFAKWLENDQIKEFEGMKLGNGIVLGRAINYTKFTKKLDEFLESESKHE